MFYRINLDKINGIRFTATVTKYPKTRIFQHPSSLFEIHLIETEPLIDEIHVLSFFPGCTPDFQNSKPKRTIALCLQTDENIAQPFSYHESFRMFRQQDFIVPDSIKVPENQHFEIKFLFSSVWRYFQFGYFDFDSVKHILYKLNYFSWDDMTKGNLASISVINSIRYIMDHYNEKIKIQQLAERVLLTPNHLSRLFQETTGRTVKEIIDIVRAAHAREELFYTKKSYPKLATDNGFSTHASMKKIFQSLFSFNPEECRNYDRKTRSSSLPYENCMLSLLFRN